ncbi:carboxylating nicotinate-nucleotide diphosphorylase [Sporomusa malonica]|uniref:Probable nicotinate-nucleotide pyrophosphorylase [carboxylating] n=1 Tax=Sporomusa malonica TaxID=112901 RepID=A0A1W2BRI9_9FIRM|nr:carboxylating nicotinate-nucleotide diphosphorylase [Sporomusa malonica]SMC75344.1 nicotinate-nucleotide pyrophosphorylase [carboxylating] [Sporomusa malonica]
MNNLAVEELLRQALKEDIGVGDITSQAIFTEDHYSEGYLLAREDMVLAGKDIFSRVYSLLSRNIKIAFRYNDGAQIPAGEKFAIIEGPIRSLLSGERVALNFLQRMSGIATETRRFVEAVSDTGALIADTRRTTPGLRMLERYAVKMGGGKSHRYGLDYMALIKDYHIQAAGGIAPAVEKVRQQLSPFVKIEIEVESLEQVREAVAGGVDVIALENMSITMIEEAVEIIDNQALAEVSGNITIEQVPELAAVGVDIISSGLITQSVKAADISMRLQ